MGETIERLDALLKEGRTEEVLEIGLPLCDPLSPIFREELQQSAELQACVGMAYYRRKDFGYALMHFYQSLLLDPANERAIYGMAYIAAYVEKDPEKTREWMEKLPESAARDNAHMIILRSKEYIDTNGLDNTAMGVVTLLQKYILTPCEDSLNVANVFHNGGRFFLVESDAEEKAQDGDTAMAKKHCASAIASLALSLGLYGTGDMNLHHRAAANYWTSVAMEKLFGPAAAVPSAEEAVKLWHRQVERDIKNTHFWKSYENTVEWTRKLREKATLP